MEIAIERSHHIDNNWFKYITNDNYKEIFAKWLPILIWRCKLKKWPENVNNIFHLMFYNMIITITTH